MTLKFALIGLNIGNSLSPKIHNAWFKKYNIDAEYEIQNIADLEKFDFAPFAGINITAPYKVQIAIVLKIKTSQPVNTIKFGDFPKAYNTDIFGIEQTFDKYNIPIDLPMLVIGSGAMAKLIADIFIDKDLSFMARDPKKLSVNCKLADKTKYPIIIHTNSGYDFDFSKLDINRDSIIFDLNYKELNNPLQLLAKEKNARYIDGKFMVIAQAAKSFEIFHGVLPDIEESLCLL